MYKRGDSWVSDFWQDGKRYTKSWGAISKTVAKEKERKYRTEIKEGEHHQKRKKILFERFTKKYLEYARLNKKPSSAKRNEVSVNMLMPSFKGILVEAIHPFQVEKYKKNRIDNGANPATVNRDVVLIKNMMKKAVEWGYLRQNPLTGVKQLKGEKEKMWVLTDEEESKLLEECGKRPQYRRNGKRHRYLRDLVEFAINTGMREGEIFRLKKTDIHTGKSYVVATDTKNHEDRNVPINDTAKEIIKRQLENNLSEYLFCNSKNKKITVLTNAFWTAVDDAGLYRFERDIKGEKVKIRFRFHDCRHTFGSRIGMNGADLKTIMEIMGHKTEKMSLRYQHPTTEHKLDVVKALDKVPSKFTTSAIIGLKKNVKASI